MFGANETPYDLRFRFLGVPVRIHPLFWLVAAVLGWHEKNVPMTAFWVVCVLVSILVHEYGHALMGKVVSRLGRRSCSGAWVGYATARPSGKRRCSAWP